MFNFMQKKKRLTDVSSILSFSLFQFSRNSRDLDSVNNFKPVHVYIIIL